MVDLLGKTLVNRYQVVEFVGRGGMAEVYKVWDPDRMIYLAAKVLLKSLAMDQVFLRRFKREADSLAKLQHPNIVRYYGLHHDEDIAFILIDFINGLSLQEWIFKQGKRLSSDFIIQITKSMCSALHYAHQRGMVHCDIKPGNIMIDETGRVLMTDFGIARMTDAATSTMVGFGTPAYMAPELIRGQDPTPATDIYSLGIVLFEMVTGGERPFTGEHAQTTGATSEKVRWEQVFLSPPLPRHFVPQIPGQIEAVIMRCLAKEPEKRFNSTLDLMNSIELASEGKLNTQSWPKQHGHNSAKPVYIPGSTVSALQPPNSLDVNHQSRSLPQKAKNKFIIPLVAILVICVSILVLMISFGRDWAQANQTNFTRNENSPGSSLSNVLTEPFTQVNGPSGVETSTETIVLKALLITETPITITQTQNPTQSSTSINASKPSVYITPTPKLYYPISNCAGSQLKVGDSAFVNYDGGKNNLRNEPDTHPSDNVIGAIYPGEVVMIVGGPVCNYGWVLWEVQTTNNEKGWTPETNGSDFWILPLTTRKICDGALPTRLVVEKKAKVNEQPPDANLIRVEPSRFDEVIGRIQPGDWMMVLEGPHCGEKANWWKVKAISSGIVGWTMEGNLEIYYLAPEP